MTAEAKIDDAIKMEIEIDASPESVFRALTDTAELSVWWVEGGTSNWKLDPRVGGKWYAEGRDTKCGDWNLRGEVLRYEPPYVFEISWIEDLSKESNAPDTKVRYELEKVGNKTRLTLTHYGFAGDMAGRERYSGGWPGVLELLQQHFA